MNNNRAYHSWRKPTAIVVWVAAALVGWIFHWGYLNTAILALFLMILMAYDWLDNTNNEIDGFIEKYNSAMKEMDRITKELQEKVEELERK